MAAKRRTVSLSKRGFDFETFMWYFTRLSALAMYALALVGLVGALIMGARTQMNMADLIRWVFTPNVTHVANTNIPDTAPWMTLFWKLTGCAFVFFAASHGLHGLLSVVEDYLTLPWLRRTLRALVLLLTAFMIFAGCYVVWTS
jgi:succinate dehydrogenase hydrophobic anchor subunit